MCTCFYSLCFFKKRNLYVVLFDFSQENVYQAQFNAGIPTKNICDAQDSLLEMFGAVLDEAKQGKKPGDRMRVSIDHASLDIPVTIHLTDHKEVTAQEIMNR